MTGRICLRSGTARAEISAQGAEILDWQTDGHALLWKQDAAVWGDTAPILFPVVGWTRGGQVRVAGKSYPLGLHGFARHRRFRVTRLAADFVRLSLDSDPETKALYPFDFRLSVDYRLDGSSLRIGLGIGNRGSEPMPYACGLHPGFAWPLSEGGQSGHRILFDQQEEPRVPEITRDGLFAPRLRSVPLKGQALALTPKLFAHEALCFLDAKSRGLRYEAKGGAALRVETENFAPCRALGEAAGAVSGDRVLDRPWRPGGFRRHTLRKAVDAVFTAGRRGMPWRALHLHSGSRRSRTWQAAASLTEKRGI